MTIEELKAKVASHEPLFKTLETVVRQLMAANYTIEDIYDRVLTIGVAVKEEKGE